MVRARDDQSGVRDDIDVSADSGTVPDETPDGMTMLEDASYSSFTSFTEAALEDEEEPVPDPVGRRRRLRWYLLGGAATVVLVLGVVLGPTAWVLLTHRDANLTTPDRLAGLTLDHSADGQATADYLRSAVAASVSLDTTIGAVYDDPDDRQRSVMFFGGTGMLLAPDKDLSDVFKLLDDQGGGMNDVHSVPAGKLGGEMKCGISTGDGGDMTVCGWADHGSLALALFPGRTPADAAALMLQMRDGIQRNA
jgi:hypothetical protein